MQMVIGESALISESLDPYEALRVSFEIAGQCAGGKTCGGRAGYDRCCPPWHRQITDVLHKAPRTQPRDRQSPLRAASHSGR
jgi:hypothetical protein